MRGRRYSIVFFVLLIGILLATGIWWWADSRLGAGYDSLWNNQTETDELREQSGGFASDEIQSKIIRVLVFECDGTAWADIIERSLFACNEKNLIPGVTFDAVRKTFQEDNKLTVSELGNYDVLVIPGGYLYKIYRNWQAEDIRAWVEKGGGYVGICAGEILAVEGEVKDSIFGSFKGLAIAPNIRQVTTDWVGVRNIRMTGLGTILLGLSGDQSVFEWNGSSFTFKNGQLALNAGLNNQPLIFATYEHNSPEPENEEYGKDIWLPALDGTAAIIGDYYGKGRIILSGPHPEYPKEQGQYQSARLLGAMVKWAFKDDTGIPFVIGRENILKQDYLAFKMGAVSCRVTEDAYISKLKIYLRYARGKGLLGIYSHDEARERPGALLAEKIINLPREIADFWQVVSFDREIFLKKGSVIWLACVFENMAILATDTDTNLQKGSFGDSQYLECELTWQDLQTAYPGGAGFGGLSIYDIRLPGHFPEKATSERRIFSYYTIGEHLSRGDVVFTE